MGIIPTRTHGRRKDHSDGILTEGGFDMDEQKTTVFEAITKDAATLAALLGSLPVLEAPWDDEFHKRFCSSCDAENCDAENCPNNAFRNNPAWWLALDASGVEL